MNAYFFRVVQLFKIHFFHQRLKPGIASDRIKCRISIK